MADERDTTLIEDILGAFTKAGSAGRQVLTEVITGEAEPGAFSDIIAGRKEVSARDLITTLEDRFKIDLTAGDEEDETLTDKVTNFGTELLVDIFTSPDSLVLGGPTRFLKSVGALKGVSKSLHGSLKGAGVISDTLESAAKVDKMVDRAVTGATFGALTAQPDDGPLEMIGATALGAATFGIGPDLVKGTAKVINAGGEAVINGLIETTTKSALNQIDNIGDIRDRVLATEGIDIGTFTGAKKIWNNMTRRTALNRRVYQEEATKILDNFESIARSRGLSEEDVLKKTDELNIALGEGEASIVSTRNDIKKSIREEIQAGNMPAMDNFDINRLATTQANELVINKIDKITSDPLIAETLGEFEKFNKRVIGTYTNTLKNRIDDFKLQRKRLLSKAKSPSLSPAELETIQDEIALIDRTINDTENAIFVPLSFHSFDYRKHLSIDRSKLGPGADIKIGSDLKKSAKILKDLNIGFRESIVDGSNAYAQLFADEAERAAGRVLGGIYSKTNKALENVRGKGFLEIMTSDKFSAPEKFLKGLDMYDGFINLMKTKHLATGTSWLITNYTDNVIKSFVFSRPGDGLKNLIETSVGIPAQAMAGAIGSSKTLEDAADFITGGRFKEFQKKNVFKQLAKAFDPTDTTPMDYSNPMIDLAGISGAIESNKFVDFKRGVNLGEDIIALKKSSIEPISENVDIVRRFIPDDNSTLLGKAQDFAWNTVGAVGSATEGTARYIVFKNTIDTLKKEYPSLAGMSDKKILQAYKRKGGSLARSVQARNQLRREGVGIARNQKRIKELDNVIRTTDDAVKMVDEATKITNDIFFDYNHVTAFEQHVMKRIFPYWTFFSRNFQQWLDAGFDPDVIARTAKATKPATNLGRKPTEDERLQTPKFILEKGARVTDSGIGKLKFAFQPSFSLFDAVGSFQDPAGSALSKLAQPIKLVGEVATGRESFGRDVPLLPSEDQPKKRILESALTLLPDDILENLGVFRDDNGRLVTNNRASAAALKAEEFLPVPQVLSQLSRAVRDKKFKDRSTAEAALNFFPALRTIDVDAESRKREKGSTESRIKRFRGGKKELLEDRRKSKKRKKLIETLR